MGWKPLWDVPFCLFHVGEFASNLPDTILEAQPNKNETPCNPRLDSRVIVVSDMHDRNRTLEKTGPGEDLDERTLIRRILTGDAAAERQLYETHVDRVFRLAYRMTGDMTQAEDLTQDTFIRAFDRLADYRGECAFGGWLHRVATSVILTALQKRKRLQNVESLREDMAAVSGAGKVENPDLRRTLNRAIDVLDDSHRMVFVMHDMEGFTHQEIATAMGTPVGTAKARLSRARQKLRDILNGPNLSLGME